MSIFATGLNAEEFSGTGNNPLTDPSELNQDNGITVMVNTDTDLGESALSETEALILDNFDKFNILVETEESGEKEITRLQDVARSIMAAETISSADIAGYIAVAAGGEESRAEEIQEKLDEVVPVSSYTETPSSVNVAETKAFFESSLYEANRRAEAQAKAFFTESASEFISSAKAISAAMTSVIKSDIYSKTSEALKISLSSKNYLANVFIKEENDAGQITSKVDRMIDIRNSPLCRYSFNSAMEDTFNIGGEFYSLLDVLLDQDVVKKYVNTVTAGRVFEYKDFCPYYRTYLEQLPDNDANMLRMTYNDLLRLYSEGVISTYFSQSLAFLEGEIRFAEAAVEFYSKSDGIFVWGDKENTLRETFSRIVKLTSSLSHVASSLKSNLQLQKALEIAMPVFNAILSKQ